MYCPEKDNDIKFTGEYFVPGRTCLRIEADHVERYQFAKNFAKGKRVLDIACGYGYGGPILLDGGAAEYCGVDLNGNLIRNAIAVYGSEKIRYEQGDICTYSPADVYDLVLCFETIEHVMNYRQALSNLALLISKDGVLLISSPNRAVTTPCSENIADKPDNIYHVQEFTVQELVRELQLAGFKVHRNDIFGQRASFFYSRNRFVMRIIYKLSGDLAEKTSPKVARPYGKTPRYFVIVARKSKG